MAKALKHIAQLLSATMLLALVVQPIHVALHMRGNGCGDCCHVIHTKPTTEHVEPYQHESHCGICSFEFASFVITSLNDISSQNYDYSKCSVPEISAVSIPYNGTNKLLRAPPTDISC